ncbi:MAG TPA: hypothetical protein VGJ33_11930 [Candidatus Angelobacter sp.]|jgi:hypothetical protein
MRLLIPAWLLVSGVAAQSTPPPRLVPSNVMVLPLSNGIPTAAKSRPIHERFATFRAGDFQSVFLLQNFRSDVSVTITPVLIVKQGELSLDPVTLQPNSSATVDITSFLRLHGIADSRGTAVMRYTFSPYDGVSGVVLSSDETHNLYVNSYAQSPEEYWEGTSFDAALWAPDNETKGTVSLINTTSEQRTANLTFLVKGHSEIQKPITLAPRETRMLNINDLVASSRETGAGIHVEYSEYPGDVLVEGHLINKKSGFEKYIHFLDKTLKYPNGTVRTQFLLLGEQPAEDGFPANISFKSVAVMRNIDNIAVNVTPTLKFTRNGAPQSVALPALNLAAGESRVIDLSAARKSGLVPADFRQGSLKLDPHTDHASIVAELFNFDDRSGGFTIGPMFFAYPGRATQSVWRTDGSFQTTIMVENTADQDDTLTLQLFSDAGKYVKTFPIGGGDLLKINLKQLQDDKVPDDEGNVLVSTSGVVSLSGVKGVNSKLSFDKLIHSADNSDYVGLPGGPGSCVGMTSITLFLTGSQNPYDLWYEEDWSDGTTEDNPAGDVSSSNTNLLQISGAQAWLLPINSSSQLVSISGQPVSRMDCPACSVDNFTPVSQVTVPPITASLTLNTASFTTQVAGGTATFTATVSVGAVSPAALPITFTITRGAASNPSGVSLTGQSNSATNATCTIDTSGGTCSPTGFGVASSSTNTNTGTVTWFFTGSGSAATGTVAVTPNPNPLRGTVAFQP